MVKYLCLHFLMEASDVETIKLNRILMKVNQEIGLDINWYVEKYDYGCRYGEYLGNVNVREIHKYKIWRHIQI